jgi:hypothetical protein
LQFLFMTHSDLEMIDRVRSFGQYTERDLSDKEILVSIDRAKNDLVTEVPKDNPDWYSEEQFTNALFWATMLNTKLQSGALGSKGMDAGDLSEDMLLASADGEVTQWYRSYVEARNSLVGFRGASRVTTSSRTSRDGNRYYEQSNLE